MAERLTAMDIEQQTFRRKMRGLDPEEVELYLRSVASEVERLNLDHARLAEENGQLTLEVGELRGREKMLQKTLVTAQGVADDLRRQAQRESELVVREAQQRAEAIVAGARTRVLELEARVGDLQFQRETFERRLRQLLDEHRHLLDRPVAGSSASGETERGAGQHREGHATHRAAEPPRELAMAGATET